MQSDEYLKKRSKVLTLPTNKILSFEEFKAMIQDEVAGDHPDNTAVSPQAQPQPQPVVENPWQAPPPVNHNENRNNPLLPDGNHHRQQQQQHLHDLMAQILAGLDDQVAQHRQVLHQLQQQRQIQNQQQALADEPFVVRWSPWMIRPLVRLVCWLLTALFRLAASALGAMLSVLGGVVLVLVVLGGEVNDGRFWRIIGFFAALKVLKFVADRVRLNVIGIGDGNINANNNDVNDLQQQQPQQQQLHDGDMQVDGAAAVAAVAAGGVAPEGNQHRARPGGRQNLLKRRLIKCVQVFFVSLSPSFRLERLLRELHEEGLGFD